MTTDTSEKGLESLICEALTGAACDPPQDSMVRERPSSYGAGWICGDTQDYDREFCIDLAQISAFLHATQPEAAESLDLDLDEGRPHAAQVLGPPARRDNKARHHRRSAQGRQARAAPDRPDVRHAVAGEREGGGLVRAEPLQCDQATPLQQRQRAACPGPVPVHQRPPCRHLRAEEQPNQADCG